MTFPLFSGRQERLGFRPKTIKRQRLGVDVSVGNDLTGPSESLSDAAGVFVGGSFFGSNFADDINNALLFTVTEFVTCSTHKHTLGFTTRIC